MKTAIYILAMILCSGTSFGSSLENPDNVEKRRSATHQITSEKAEKRLQEIKGLLKVTETTDTKNVAQQVGVPLSDLNLHLEKLRKLKTAYGAFLIILNDQITLNKEESILKDKISRNRVAVPEKPPYTLSYYDQIRDQLDMVEQQKETAQLGKRFIENAMKDAQSLLEHDRSFVKHIQQQLNNNVEKQNLPKLKWKLTDAKLNEELAKVSLGSLHLKSMNTGKEIQIADLEIQIARQNLYWVTKNLQFSKADLQKQLNGLQKQRNGLQKRIKKLASKEKDAERAWLQVQHHISKAKTQGRVTEATSDLLTARASWRVAYQRILGQAEDMLLLFSQMEELWKRRYQLIEKGAGLSRLENWSKEAEAHIESLDRTLTLENHYQRNLQSHLATLKQRISGKDALPEAKKYIKNQIAALENLTEKRFDYVTVLLRAKEFNERLIDEIDSHRKQNSVEQKLSVLSAGANTIWASRVWVINNHSMTVSNLVVAFIVLLGGILLIKYLMRFSVKRLFPRTHIDAGLAASLEKLLYYFGVLLVFLIALRIVNIPLTAFTFLGGAVAIGVGFGAQNIINNFISGFILMTERPIRIGDLIEMGGKAAKVAEVGARCTKIHTGENVDILVPNSSFLQNNITNWTLTNRKLRINVTVGVAYGSPVREVERLLLKAAEEHDRVLKNEKPFVVFSDFGESALVFKVYFWISVSRLMDRETVKSDIRFHIDELFRNAGITIAFPQRDIHIDTLAPLEFTGKALGGGVEEVKRN